MIARTQLAEHLASLSTHLTNFDGLTRKLGEWQTQGEDPALLEDHKKGVQESRGNVDAAEAAISACLVRLDGIPANGRDLKLRQQLLRRTAAKLQPLKLQLKTIRAIADQLNRNLSGRRG